MNIERERLYHWYSHRELEPFRGSHETPGEFVYGAFNSDIVDLGVVVKYLKSRYSYTITTIIAHSKGANVAMRYLCTINEATADINCFVNVSGRYRMVRAMESSLGIFNSRSHRFFALQRIDCECLRLL